MKQFILLGLSISMVITLCGCETMKGVVKDLQNTGDNIWEAVMDK